MDKLYSHYSKNHKKRLFIHLKNVANKSKNKILAKGLDLSLIKQGELAKLSYLIGLAHDFAKATSYFQKYLIYGENHQYSHHGLLSALFAYVLVNSYFDNQIFSMIAYMVVKRHHGNLESPLEEPNDIFYQTEYQLENIKTKNRDKVKEIYKQLLLDFEFDFEELLTDLTEVVREEEDFIEQFEEIVFFELDENKEDKAIELFLITNLLYSVLIDTDKKDAALVDNSYFAGGIEEKIDVKDYIADCRKRDPEKFDPKKEINQARNEFLAEVLNNPELKKENYLYSLTAPTGIGKTFASFSFANKLKGFYSGGRRIIYSLPFTSIIDQNYDVFEDIIEFNLEDEYRNYPTKYLLRHHYLTPMRLKKNVNLKYDSEKTKNLDKYLEEKLLLESWESGNIVTTFVQVFESIIGNKNSYLKKFHNIINSIMILDEVQNIPPKYYKVVGKVLKVLAKRFNTDILLLTATQPEIIQGADVVSLVDDKKYAKADIFDRVRLEIVDDLKEKTLAEFVEYFDYSFNSYSGLIVCNTIKSALNLFESINDLFYDYEVFSLTTYQIPIDRRNKIAQIREKIKAGKKIIVVSTQLIEAGVDLSFAEVYRDLGPLDSIVQVAGRCNRNGELAPKKGRVKIIQLKQDDDSKPDCKKVYDPILIQFCNQVLEDKKSYSAKDFIDLSKDYFAEIRKKVERESKRILKAIKELNYSKSADGQIPIKDFELIKEQGGKEDIIICKEEEDEDGNIIDIEQKIEELSVLYEELKEVNGEQERLNSLLGQIELIKKELAQYRVSVYRNQLEKYYEHDLIEGFRFIKYVTYENQKEYLYSEEIGFLEEPKKEFQTTLFI
ncbi:CRISPR-associated helicase Cas3' [Natroniella sp. ANB-PHB2]|uniref:CRISPR-associated helicase Cas3' n=1 Tax=Natroniella sp. ANB-PHB2 TaxID=3384444 RepID=UPI0038D3D7E4